MIADRPLNRCAERVRLLLVLFAVLLGSAQPINVVHADAYTYDGPPPVRTEVAGATAAVDASCLLSSSSATQVERSSSGRDTSTTPSALGNATNVFDPSPKHDQNRPRVGSQPRNGQSALDHSVQLSENSTRRVGVDKASGEIVVFDETHPGQCIFHGHVRTWDEITNKMRSSLYKAGLTDLKGRIL